MALDDNELNRRRQEREFRRQQQIREQKKLILKNGNTVDRYAIRVLGRIDDYSDVGKGFCVKLSKNLIRTTYFAIVNGDRTVSGNSDEVLVNVMVSAVNTSVLGNEQRICDLVVLSKTEISLEDHVIAYGELLVIVNTFVCVHGAV